MTTDDTDVGSVDAGEPIAVTVVGGYLGAGKTTAINELLRDPRGERLAVLVNDFGEIGVDADLIVDRNDQGAISRIDLANGCVCCSLAGALPDAFAQLRELNPPPDRVVVEVSGVGEPAKVATWGRLPGFRVDGVVVLVDAENVRRLAADRYVGDTVHRQIADADVLALTKTDLVDPEEVDWVRRFVASVAPDAEVLAGRSAGADALRLPVRSSREHSARRDGHSSVLTASVTWDHARLDVDSVTRLMGDLPPGIVRAKGIVRCDKRRVVVHRVGRRVAVTDAGPWTQDEPSRLVVVFTPEADAVAVSDQLDEFRRWPAAPTP